MSVRYKLHINIYVSFFIASREIYLNVCPKNHGENPDTKGYETSSTKHLRDLWEPRDKHSGIFPEKQ